MNNTQIKKPGPYILGGIGGILLGVLLLYGLQYILQGPNETTLLNWQMRFAIPIYVLLILSFGAILRGVSLAYHLRRYEDEL
jgi:ABC-type antimicrobial peptide transport system permease subunit